MMTDQAHCPMPNLHLFNRILNKTSQKRIDDATKNSKSSLCPQVKHFSSSDRRTLKKMLNKRRDLRRADFEMEISMSLER